MFRRLRNFTVFSGVFGASLAALLSGCGGTPAEPTVTEQVGETTSELVASKGIVPYPKKQSNGVPVLTNGKPTVMWNGSLTDLLAADAMSMCFNSSWYAYRPQTLITSDTYLNYLASKMVEVIGGANVQAEKRWYTMRKTSTLNMNSSTLANQAVVFPPHDDSAYWLMPNTQVVSTADAQRRVAHIPMFTAENNLCMAQNLQEFLSTAPILLLTPADQREMLEVIRQRAQVAMLEYSRLAQMRPAAANSTNLLNLFAEQPVDRQAIYGGDFAAAVSLHASAARELAAVFMRSGAARLAIPSAGTAATAPDADWRLGSWRHRVLSLLYGGDPLSKQANGVLWQKFAGDTRAADALEATRLPYVAEDARVPEVKTLLSLARAADALTLAISPKETLVAGGSFYEKIDFGTLDVESSLETLYRGVEASLRHPECIQAVRSNPASRACVTARTSADVPTLANFTSSLLWQRHKVSLDHARSLVRMLGQAMPRNVATCNQNLPACWVKPGAKSALHFVGDPALIFPDEYWPWFNRTGTYERTAAALPGLTGMYYHLPASFSFVPYKASERATPFLDSSYQPGNFKSSSGIPDADQKFGQSNDDRQMGAVSALVYARDSILALKEQNERAPTPSNTEFLKLPAKAIEVVNGAIGTTSISIHPEVTTTSATLPGTCTTNSGTGTCTRVVVQRNPASAQGIWYWRATLTQPKGSTQSLVYTPDTEETMIKGTPISCFPYSRGVVPVAVTDPNVQQTRYLFTDSTISPRSFYLSKDGTCTKATDHLATVQLKGLESQGMLLPTRSYHIANGGTLGDIAEKAWAVQNDNWAQPAFDGFGLPLGYVPIVDTTLLGSPGVTYSMDHYLSLAEAAATDASNKTRIAVEALLDQEIDDQAASNAQLEANTLAADANVSLCGAEQCEVSSQEVDLYAALSVASQSSSDTSGTVSVVGSLFRTSATLLTPVATQLSSAILPNFGSTYGASTLKAAADEQWNSVRKAKNLLAEAATTGAVLMSQITEAQNAASAANTALTTANQMVTQRLGQVVAEAHVLSTATKAYESSVAAGQVRLDEAVEKKERECSSSAMNEAMMHGKSISCATGESTYSLNKYHCSDAQGTSYSFGPLDAQEQLCEDSRQAMHTAEAEQTALADNKPPTNGMPAAVAAYVDALGNAARAQAQVTEAQQRVITAVLNRADGVRALMTRADDANAQIQGSSTAALKAEQDTRHNTGELRLREQMTTSQLRTRFGTWQRFHSADVEVARNALESARKYALIARRALEARFVVDLSAMRAAEFTTPAPSTWADTIYDFDLDLLGSTGIVLNANPTGASDNNTTGPSTATKISEYVAKLRNVRNNFFVNRPTQAARNEVELFSLPGPGAMVET
ncbi:MAG: hypothetical protein K0R38_6529, partial [Polyangiaceae bacterium]|nr:hypothetical protein [Polyangiaceae bacterium]